VNIFAFNGSPRKTWNTATLLKKALEGAASQGAGRKYFQQIAKKLTKWESGLPGKMTGIVEFVSKYLTFHRPSIILHS
jgi:hypothetical protein